MPKSRIFALIFNMSNRNKNYLLDGFLKRNNAVLLRSGINYFLAVEKLIKEATHEIHLQTYILEPDETGRRIANALIAASKERGVKVFLMVDAYGSKNLKGPFLQELRDAGIRVKKFGQLYSGGRFHIGRRLHHKILVADGEVAIVGGINISNNYSDTPPPPSWLDFALEIRGNVPLRLLLFCRRKWLRFKFIKQGLQLRDKLTQPGQFNTYFLPVRISQNDFVRGKNEIALSYREAIRKAKKTLLIVGGYFLPGGRIRRLLQKARERGVEIKILIPEHSDVKLIRYSMQYLDRWLLRHSIQIYEYLPSNVHGKVLIADKKFMSIGSYDLNNLSTYSNIELNLEVADEQFCSAAHDQIERIMNRECRLVSLEEATRRSTYYKLIRNWLAYRFTKMLFVLSLLLSNDEEKGD